MNKAVFLSGAGPVKKNGKEGQSSKARCNSLETLKAQ